MATRKWSQDVTEHSDALDLEQGVFALDDPAEIARSLKRSAEHSSRRKAEPYRSAMSMLTFYINRAGKDLPPARRKILEAAKTRRRATSPARILRPSGVSTSRCIARLSGRAP
jgi:phosphoenolpyruvate carboxylase